MRNTVVAADAMRTYIIKVRDELGITPQAFAKAIGMPYTTFRDYETGTSTDLKANPLARAIDILNIPIEHIKLLGRPETTTKEATELANERLQKRAESIAVEASSLSQVDALEIVRQIRGNPQALRELWDSFVDAGFDTEQH